MTKPSPRTTRGDFQFLSNGFGHYRVTYTSPTTGKQWSVITSDMRLIDATKNEDTPTTLNLNKLKAICKAK